MSTPAPMGTVFHPGHLLHGRTMATWYKILPAIRPIPNLESGHMSSYKYRVYRIGVHARDLLEPERLELEKVGAEEIVLPRIEGDELIEKAGDAHGIIDVDSPITRRDMEAMADLKVVLRTGVGVDVIDVDAATDLGIAVVCVPDLWIREVAKPRLRPPAGLQPADPDAGLDHTVPAAGCRSSLPLWGAYTARRWGSSASAGSAGPLRRGRRPSR